MRRAISAAADFPSFLVTIGVTPKFPHTGLGYIRLGKEIEPDDGNAPLFSVDSFIEKPDRELAEKLSASKRYLWNTGYKTGRADAILEMMKLSCPDYRRRSDRLLNAVKAQDDPAVEQCFRELPRISFEILVSGRIEQMLAMATDLDWSDAGDWDVIHRLLSNDDADRFRASQGLVW